MDARKFFFVCAGIPRPPIFLDTDLGLGCPEEVSDVIEGKARGEGTLLVSS
jgi:hypothetical protein